MARRRPKAHRARLFGAMLVALVLLGPPHALGAQPNDAGLHCARTAGFWSKVRAGAVDRYCHHLRSMRALVWLDAPRARAHQEQAEALFVGARETKEQAALLLLAEGSFEEAHASFQALPPRLELRQDGALGIELGRARAALASGHASLALASYRPVVLALDQVRSPGERARVLLEASVAASYASAARYPEAEAYLRASSRELSPLVEPLRAAMKLLHAVRSLPEGQRRVGLGALGADAASRRTTAPEAGRGARLAWILAREKRALGAPNELLPVLPPGELEQILAAVSYEADPEGARAAFAAAAVDGGLPLHIRSAASELGGAS